jgi:CheY-like chemotaxis protein
MIDAPSIQHTVLVLDDEQLICETLADYLIDMGHLVYTYADGATALDALQKHTFTVAIVDIRLPGIGGFAFMERASNINQNLRYIIHTGSLDFGNGELKQGASDRIEAVLIKPVERLQDFLDILARMG